MNLTGELRTASVRQLFFVVLIIIAVLLRAGNLGEFRNIEADERFWLGIGISLIQSGVPTAWTLFSSGYLAAGVAVGTEVTPNLDHPPLFPLIVGAWAHLIGQSDMAALDWSLVRIPMIVISIVTIIVTYLFVRRVFGGGVATFTLLAFVFFPSHIIVSRSIAAEHLIGLLLMLGLYLFAVFEMTESRKIKRIVWAAMILLCVASLMVKLSAIVIPATLCFLALYRRRWWLSVMLILATLVSALLLLGYGYYYNWDAFLNVLDSHNGRPQNFWNFWSLFTSLDIGYYRFYDPSLIVGLIGALGLAMKKQDREGMYIFVPLFVFSLLFLYVAPIEAYGWYKYAVYPLIAVGLGYVFYQLFEQRLVYVFLFLPLLSIMLQNSGVLGDQAGRRSVVLMFYGIVTITLLLRNRLLRFKPIFLTLLLFLFAFEVLCVSRVLGYIG